MSRRKIIILVFCLCSISGLYGYHSYALRQFEKAYAEYAKAATAHDEAAMIPMLSGNPLRRDLNAALTEVLVEDASAATRLKKAQEGEALLVLAEGNIDAVGEVAKDVTENILAMEEYATFALLTARGAADDIIERAQRRASIVADIRALSYRANHHTKEIFDRIRADSGELTLGHVATLERLLPEVEEEFNRRSNLSIELSVARGEVEKAFAEFEKVW